MEKRISYSQFQQVKRAAQMCNPLVLKREAVKTKIEKLAAEYRDFNSQIEALGEGIKNVTGFYPEELVKKVIEPGVDVNGQPKKTTKYLPTSIVSYDEVKKQYVITTPDETTQQPAEPAETSIETTTEETTSEETPSEVQNFPADAPIFE